MIIESLWINLDIEGCLNRFFQDSSQIISGLMVTERAKN